MFFYNFNLAQKLTKVLKPRNSDLKCSLHQGLIQYLFFYPCFYGPERDQQMHKIQRLKAKNEIPTNIVVISTKIESTFFRMAFLFKEISDKYL